MRYIGLDLSTKTGRVALSPSGEVLEHIEIHHKLDDPSKMNLMVFDALFGLTKDDFVALEGFSYGSRGKSVDKQYGIGWLVRVELWKREIPFTIVAPSSLKKFAGAKGNAKKDALAIEIYKRWNYEHPSDNVRDAYVLAQIARAIHEPIERTKFQDEVIKKVVGG
ncbi:hypothetical protein [Aneurinibacillus migulanus]|uniref:hypothetical protein n=1 Tax=Aneurinibacillus migulanus TaxID=47500 RepID=UPI0020A0A378|nr:hypothetical protein [Aneurinibacillus migulanus]MCP1355068.1 hypothetical protein [Aneurinibacillus migulanus]